MQLNFCRIVSIVRTVLKFYIPVYSVKLFFGKEICTGAIGMTHIGKNMILKRNGSVNHVQSLKMEESFNHALYMKMMVHSFLKDIHLLIISNWNE